MSMLMNMRCPPALPVDAAPRDQARDFIPRADAEYHAALTAQRGIVKKYAECAGSLRSGFLTLVAEAGAWIWKLAEQSRHKSLDTLRGYVRRVDLFKEHAGAAFL
jgi:hypothetical protein